MSDEELTPDPAVVPVPDLEANVPIIIPLLEENDYELLIGQVEIVGDTATIKLADGTAFADRLKEGSVFIGMSVQKSMQAMQVTSVYTEATEEE